MLIFKKIRTWDDKHLKQSDEYDEVFALEYIHLCGKWDFPEQLCIIDLPGISFSAHQVCIANYTIHTGELIFYFKNTVIRSILATADIIVSVAPRGLDNNAIEQLLKYDAFSQKQSVLDSVYRSNFILPNELRDGIH